MPTILDARASAMQAADKLPLFSVILQRALFLFSQGDDVSIDKVSSVIEQDVVTAGSILSIANSALYGRGTRVASIRQAVNRLGIDKTRNALLGLSVARLFKGVQLPEPWSASRFNTHSLATAVLSDLIATNTPALDAEWGFLTGLLHDIGLFLLVAGLPDTLAAITVNGGDDFHVVERERELFGFTHFDLGTELLARWNCPREVQDAVQACQQTVVQYDAKLSLGAVTKTASLLADACGISTFNSTYDQELADSLLSEIKIVDPVRFMKSFEREYSGLKATA
jgi:HD-like signal output (HDOD) protein